MKGLTKWLAEHPAQAAALRHAGTLLLALLLGAVLSRDVALQVCAQLAAVPSEFVLRSSPSPRTPSTVLSPG